MLAGTSGGRVVLGTTVLLLCDFSAFSDLFLSVFARKPRSKRPASLAPLFIYSSYSPLTSAGEEKRLRSCVPYSQVFHMPFLWGSRNSTLHYLKEKRRERNPQQEGNKNGQGMTAMGMSPYCRSVPPPCSGCTSNTAPKYRG